MTRHLQLVAAVVGMHFLRHEARDEVDAKAIAGCLCYALACVSMALAKVMLALLAERLWVGHSPWQTRSTTFRIETDS